MSFLAELKRRNVFRVGIAYLVVSWLILQVADVILGNFDAPSWVFRAILLTLAIGLPLMLLFAWAFELTPEGLKLDKDVDRSETITAQTGAKLNRIIIATLIIAVGYFAIDKFVLSSARDAALIETTTQAITEQSATEQEAAAKFSRSIAVLPFVDMSPDKDQEYMSDGLSEELLNLLAKIPDLRVTSRSSAFAFKGEKIDIPAVARKLNVAHILEGSVRKAGQQIRITAQLIDAGADKHLWSETYDRSLDNIFAIQDEIAAAVVAQLKITLLGDAPTVRETDPEAYALFLQARHLFLQRNAESYEQAVVLLKRALAIDPDYAAAWNGLSGVYASQANSGLVPTAIGYPLALEASTAALAIDPNYAPAHEGYGYIAMVYGNDLAEAAEHYERALQLEPANTDIIRNAATLTRYLGRLDDAIALGQFITARDPVNPAGYANLGLSYHGARRWGEEIAAFRTALTLSPNYIGANYNVALALMFNGEPEAAFDAIQREQSIFRLVGLPMVLHALGRKTESDEALAELITKYERDTAYNIAYILAFRGEVDRAFEWLDKAVQYKDGGLPGTTTRPEFENLHDDPRWLPFLDRIGQSPEQLSGISFQVPLPG